MKRRKMINLYFKKQSPLSVPLLQTMTAGESTLNFKQRPPNTSLRGKWFSLLRSTIFNRYPEMFREKNLAVDFLNPRILILLAKLPSAGVVRAILFKTNFPGVKYRFCLITIFHFSLHVKRKEMQKHSRAESCVTTAQDSIRVRNRFHEQTC